MNPETTEDVSPEELAERTQELLRLARDKSAELSLTINQLSALIDRMR